jgi:conjugative transfer region protein (TIGR03748 family)
MKVYLAICLLVFSSLSVAEEYRQVGRYSSVLIAPSQSQLDPLTQYVDLNVPKHLTHIHEVVNYVLAPTGYRVPMDSELLDSYFVAVGKQPLPNSQRKLKGTVVDVLKVLVGEGFIVVRDDIQRTLVLDFIGRE